jgi:hypothetical protein
MIEHYARDVKMPVIYMGQDYNRDKLDEQADKTIHARNALEEYGYLATRVRSAPPQCMSAAFLLSVLGRWKESFQRTHKGQKIDDLDIADALERAQTCTESTTVLACVVAR